MVQINIRRALICLCELAAGVMLWMNPELLTMGLTYLFGAGLLLFGIWDGVTYFRTEVLHAAKEQKIFFGLLKVGVGVTFLIKTRWIVSAFPALPVLYGILLLIVSAQKIQWSVDMKRMKKEYWHLAAISGVVSLGFAVITMLDPFRTTTLLWQILGVVLGIGAIADGVILALSNIGMKAAETIEEKEEDTFDDRIADADFAPPEDLVDLDAFTKTEEHTETVEQPEGFLDFSEASPDIEEMSAEPEIQEEEPMQPEIEQTEEMPAEPEIQEEESMQPEIEQTGEMPAESEIQEEESVQPETEQTEEMPAEPEIQEEEPVQPETEQIEEKENQ